MTASSTAVRAPVRARTQRRGMGFHDAARPLAVDDAHHDGARLGAGELGDDRDAQPADPERHRDEESVEFLGQVVVGRAGR